MLKRLCKRPAFWSLLVLTACTGWYCRPLDRSTLFPVQFANGKFGYVTADSRTAIACEWDRVYAFASDGRALVETDGIFWFIDRYGSLTERLGSSTDSDIENLPVPVLIWGTKRGVFLGSGQVLIWNEELERRTEKHKKWGLRHRGEQIVEPQWDDIAPFDAADLATVRRGKKWGFIGRDGKVAIPIEWDSAHSFTNFGLACVRQGNRWGFLDRAGKVAIELEWDMASSFSDNGLAPVRKADKYGYIDRTGKVVIPLEFDDASPFDAQNMARVAKNKQYGFIDSAGQIVVPLAWDRVGDFDGQPPHNEADVVVVDGNGIPKSFRTAEELAKGKSGVLGLAQCEKNGKHGIINRKGDIVTPPIWKQPLYFDSHKMAIAVREEKYGFIDSEGKIVIPLRWDGASNFNKQQMARIILDWKYGLINRKGEVIISTECAGIWIPEDDLNTWPYPMIDNPRSDIIRLKTFSGYGWFDLTGEIIVTPEWAGTEIFTDAGSKRYAFVAVRPIGDDARPGWLKATLAWFQRVIGREESRSVLCHLYDTDGRLLWSSDWLSSEFKLLVAVAIAGLVLAFDGFAIWRRRRRRGEFESKSRT